MHNLGLKEPKIEERGNDVLVTIRHEALASPEQAVMRYLETHDTIRNKQAREITHIKDSLKGHCKTGHAGSLQNRPWEGSRDLDVVLFRSLFGQV